MESRSSDMGLAGRCDLSRMSSALTTTECNYAQIEMERLSIAFATECFDQYILGRRNVPVQTDYMPYWPSSRNQSSVAPRDCCDMRLRLHKYSRTLSLWNTNLDHRCIYQIPCPEHLYAARQTRQRHPSACYIPNGGSYPLSGGVSKYQHGK